MSKARHPAYYYYLYGVTALGFVLIVFSVIQVLRPHVPLQWIIVASLTILTGSFTVRIPGLNSKISVADTFIFANLILFGIAAGTITAALDSLTGSLRSHTGRRRLEYALFNMGATALSAYIAGATFFAVIGQPPLFQGQPPPLRGILISVVLMALVHHLVNSGSVAAMVALDSRQGVYAIWREGFLWTSLTSFTGASVAGLIALNVNAVTPAVFGIITPTVLIIYFTYRTYLEKVDEKVRHLQELNKLYLSTVETLAMAIDAKDQVTHGHVRRVQVYARELARAMGVADENVLRGIDAAALLHDIGKLAIPEYILNKPGELTRNEFQKMMEHPVVGADILGSINFPFPVADYVRHHHEHWNGTGYPDNLKGVQIPLGARILAVVDCFEALTCDRPYRPAFSTAKALDIIRARAGKQYDPEVVAKFEHILERAQETLQETELPDMTAEGWKAISGTVREPERLKMRRPRDMMVFQDISSSHREVFALFELAQTVGSTLNLQETLLIIASKIEKIVPFTTCVIYLLDPEKNRLRAGHVSGANIEAFRGREMNLGEYLSGSVAAASQPAINANPILDVTPVQGRIAVELDNALVCPLNFVDTCMGVISLYTSHGVRFTDDHVRVMEIVSKQAATAIHNALKFEETQEDAFTDRLTHLPNSRWLYLYFEQEMEKAIRFQYPLSLLGMDLDGFKEINDQYGHPVGDRMLVEVARMLSSNLRASDVVVRYAGDEFVAIMPQTSAKDATLLAKRMQAILDEFRLEVRPGKYAQIGISIGVASYPVDADSLDALMAKADENMYRDKEERARSSRLISREVEPRVRQLQLGSSQ
jgi:diguanylate cyclase (GGDEF)-like protein/putative nucleotidyltransferase with HDIG domain